VLDPHDGDPFGTRAFDETRDVVDDDIALVGPVHDADLHVDDQ